MKLAKFPILREILIEQRRTMKYAIERPRTERQFRELTRRRTESNTRDNFFPHLGILFVHIPKTAGTSIHQTLTEAEDTLLPTNGPTTPRPSLDKHSKAAEWRDSLGEEVWNSLFKFCLVRNPFDLMVSSYFWWLQKAKKFPSSLRDAIYIEELGSFDKFMRSRYGESFINEFPGTMSDWFSEKGNDVLDFVGKVENIDSDFPHVMAHSNVSTFPVQLPKTNTTLRSYYREYYTAFSRRLVERRFSDVIERFGYDF